jgi:hypothetical protein
MLFGSPGGSLWLLLKLCNISVQQLHLNSQKKKKKKKFENDCPKIKGDTSPFVEIIDV